MLAKKAKLEMLEELADQMRSEIAKGYGDEEMEAEDVSEAVESAHDSMEDKPEEIEAESDYDMEDDEPEEMEGLEDCAMEKEPKIQDSVRDFMKKKSEIKPEGAMIVIKSMSAEPMKKMRRKKGKM